MARVTLQKSTGALIEYQSNATKDTLLQNAINCGWNPNDIEEKEVTQPEWETIRKQWIDDPAEEKQKKKEKERAAGKSKLKTLGLTDPELNALFW